METNKEKFKITLKNGEELIFTRDTPKLDFSSQKHMYVKMEGFTNLLTIIFKDDCGKINTLKIEEGKGIISHKKKLIFFDNFLIYGV